MKEGDMTSNLAMHYFNQPLPSKEDEIIPKRKKSGDENEEDFFEEKFKRWKMN